MILIINGFFLSKILTPGYISGNKQHCKNSPVKLNTLFRLGSFTVKSFLLYPLLN